MNVLEIKELNKKFRLSHKQKKEKRTNSDFLVAVDNVSLDLNEKEIYGLLGPNGAGKTTTLRMIATLLTPDSGKIILKGNDVTKKPNELRKAIGFLTSELELDGFFTPDYTFDFFATLYGVEEKVKNQRKEELFASFGINDYKYTKIEQLSTGMKQKVSLVVSLVNNPDIIVFDEPTNGLDILATKIVEEYLLKLKKEGKTIIISTHIFSLVEKLCDRVGIIIEGKLVYQGMMKEIGKEESLEKIFFSLYEKYSLKGEK